MSRRSLLVVGWATLVANIVIILTGALVRLTDSGLGCPNWPHCEHGSFTPHGAMSIHTAIEFGNRTLTFVLVVVAVATLVVVLRSGRRDLRLLAWIPIVGIPVQAVVGGIAVLSDLNPWVVQLHLLASLAIVSAAVVLLDRIHAVPADERLAGATGRAARLLTVGALVATWLVLYAGTVVTGSGPHAGSAKSPRNGLDPLQVSQFHADLVFLLVGLTVACVVVLRVSLPGTEASRAALVVLAVELTQAAVGFTQYFTHLPVGLVAVHVLLAAILTACVTWLLVATRRLTA